MFSNHPEGISVHILTAYPDTEAAAWLQQSARCGVPSPHRVVDDPRDADAILFMEGHPDDPFMERVIFHPLRRKYPERSFLYQDHDVMFPLMQGLYPSLRSKDAIPGYAAGAPYYAREARNEAVTKAALDDEYPRDLLASFVGARTAPVRSRILDELSDPEIYLEDTTGRHAWLLPQSERCRYEERFASISLRSRYILCPRGIGPSSYRLYEAMEMGRCPVVLSDEFAFPSRLGWQEFAVIIPESDVHEIPRILRDHDAEQMGEKARLAFLEGVAQQSAFHYIAETLAGMLSFPGRRPGLRVRAAFSSDVANYLLRARLRRLKPVTKLRRVRPMMRTTHDVSLSEDARPKPRRP